MHIFRQLLHFVSSLIINLQTFQDTKGVIRGTKGVIRGLNSIKNRQCNSQAKKDKEANNSVSRHNTTQKTIEQHEPH